MLQRSLASSWTSSSSCSSVSLSVSTSVPLLCFLLCFTWHSQIVPVEAALYFAKFYDKVVISLDFPPDQVFYEAQVLRTKMQPRNPSLQHHIINSTSISKDDEIPIFIPSLISIQAISDKDSQGIQLVLRRSLTTKLRRSFNVEICPNGLEADILRELYCLTLKVKIVNSSSKLCNVTDICFGYSANLTYGIVRDSGPQSVARLSQPIYQRMCGAKVNYAVEDASEDGVLVVVDDVLKIAQPFSDFERLTYRLVCDVTYKEQNFKVDEHGSVYVREANHGRPRVISKSKIYVKVTEQISTELQTRLFIIVDDDPQPSPYSVRIANDSRHFFNLTHESEKAVQSSNISYRYIKAMLHPNKDIRFRGSEYVFDIVFTDLTLDDPGVSSEAKLTVVLTKKPEELFVFPIDRLSLEAATGTISRATIFHNAALHSRVHRPFNSTVTKSSGVEFYLEAEPSETIFPSPINVTPIQGILYVNDSEQLQNIDVTDGDRVFRVKMNWRDHEDFLNESFIEGSVNKTFDKDGALGYILIEISIKNSESGVAFKEEQCGYRSMCSKYDNEDACTSNCGQGADKGSCQWKNITDAMSSFAYATCSPNFDTCPDNECDELESKFVHICLQDCVDPNNLRGFYLTHTNDSLRVRGIPPHVTSTCTCDEIAICSCFIPNDDSNHSNDIKRNRHNRTNGQSSTGSVFVLPVSENNKSNECGVACVVVITGSVIIVGFVVVMTLFVCLRRQSRKLRDGHHKYLGSSASLPVVPSDYVDERSSSIASQNVINNDLTVTMSNKYSPIDSKWEFPRSRLILDQTLGEGEFGRVMKAKAIDINNQSGQTTVAVKMLKSNSSSSEQDLLSEFNLLKDIYHINVIHLLGACSSKDGPLYIIVEYAEYGSLRSYLRKSRRLEFKSCTSDDSGVDSLASGNQADHLLSEYQVNPRDLLSFAWQIAKGMEYLSEMKLVHRDLAARNILVAAGKVVKISDFGLTRDVYEGDAYLKKSMGRVPVKWMAIESLVDHIYTTKSDVWSYGIVLWEIVTLGSAPYPGVLPERLFHLLKNGYRMEKPDNCSDELYAIMRKCWQERPQDRPHFYELTKIFDDMLQANVEYLDLRLNIVQNRAYFDDNPALTDTIGEEVEEGDGSEMGYGSLNVLPTDDSEYLTSNSRSAEYDEDAFLLTSPSYEMMSMAKSNLPLSDDEHVV